MDVVAAAGSTGGGEWGVESTGEDGGVGAEGCGGGVGTLLLGYRRGGGYGRVAPGGEVDVGYCFGGVFGREVGGLDVVDCCC